MIVVDADGNVVGRKPGELIADGQRLVVPMVLMDGVQRYFAARTNAVLNDSSGPAVLHARGYLPQTGAQREARTALYQKRDQRITNAWRIPDAALQSPQQALPQADTGQGGLAAAYARRDARLRDAWRGAGQ